MEVAIMYSALFLMPVFAFVFMLTFLDVMKRIKDRQNVDGGYTITCGISFALMMWTLSSTILITAP